MKIIHTRLDHLRSAQLLHEKLETLIRRAMPDKREAQRLLQVMANDFVLTHGVKIGVSRIIFDKESPEKIRISGIRGEEFTSALSYEFAFGKRIRALDREELLRKIHA